MTKMAPFHQSFGPHSCGNTVNATVGGGHLVTLGASLPCTFPKCRRLGREITGTICEVFDWDLTGYRAPTYRVQSENSTCGQLHSRPPEFVALLLNIARFSVKC